VGIDSWRYYYNASFSNLPGSGAYNSAELSAAFGTYPQKGATKLQRELSQGIQKACADFAKNPSSGPGWEPVPRLAIFGPNLKAGGDNVTKGVFQVGDPKNLDLKCKLYQGLYS
jgi:cholinesterase